jgi:replicative DNA helicase
MREADANALAFTRVAVADLYCYPHRLVYGAALELWGAFCAVTPADVYRRLWMRGQLVDLGHDAASWLWDVYETDPTGFDCLAAAETVLSLSLRRQAIVRQRELLGQLERGRLAPEELAELI